MLRQNKATVLTHSGSEKTVANSAGTLDTLPKQFVLSMKKLFDILDEKHSGFVRFVDIEKGWQDDGSKGLPQGVLDSLRRVTPPSGQLSFERFCAGLKLCLLRNQQTNVAHKQVRPTRPPSAPQLSIPLPSTAPTVAIGPRSQALFTASPHLQQEFVGESGNVFASPAPPPKPPRQASIAKSPATQLAKADIRHALQNWQLNLMHGEQVAHASHKGLKSACGQYEHRGSADGGSSSTSATDYVQSMTLALPPKKSSNKRREARRHTLQHGIDYNMLKRLKQLEEQRELLLFGLDGVEKARDWYMQQVLNVQEQIKYFGCLGTHCETWTETQQERLNFQRARVLEANRVLAILTDTWEHGGYPLHINLALPSQAKQHYKHYPSLNSDKCKSIKYTGGVSLHDNEHFDLVGRELYPMQEQQHQAFQHFHSSHGRNISEFELTQSSPESQSSAGLGDADVVY